MTFEEFQLTRTRMEAGAFGEKIGDAAFGDDPDRLLYVYDGCWWIEDTGTTYQLLLDRGEHVANRCAEGLKRLEGLLFDYACDDNESYEPRFRDCADCGDRLSYAGAEPRLCPACIKAEIEAEAEPATCEGAWCVEDAMEGGTLCRECHENETDTRTAPRWAWAAIDELLGHESANRDGDREADRNQRAHLRAAMRAMEASQ